MLSDRVHVALYLLGVSFGGSPRSLLLCLGSVLVSSGFGRGLAGLEVRLGLGLVLVELGAQSVLGVQGRLLQSLSCTIEEASLAGKTVLENAASPRERSALRPSRLNSRQVLHID